MTGGVSAAARRRADTSTDTLTPSNTATPSLAAAVLPAGPSATESAEPAHVRRLANDVARWAAGAGVRYLSRVDVPGPNEHELNSLSALGALAGALSSDLPSGLPIEVANWIASGDTTAPTDLVAAIAASQPHEVLARAYELIVSGPNRRVLGTFFTPTPIVKHMIALCEEVDGAPECVIDPGAGVGAFTQAALRRWPSARVSAVDLNVVTLGLLAVCVPIALKPRLDLVFDNYLTWSTPVVDASADRSDTSAHAAHSDADHADGAHVIGQAGATGSTELGASRDSEGAVSRTLVIGNPPYTRHQHLSPEDKQLAQAAAGDLVFSGLAGLSTYFAASAVRSLHSQDSACLLLPGNWCQARYGRELRQWLWSETRRQVRIQMFPAAAEVFPGTQVTAMVLYVGPERHRRQQFWLEQLELSRPKSSSATATAADALEITTVVTGRRVLKDREQTCPAVFKLADDLAHDNSETVRLADIARIRRGVATGANKFFFLDDARQAEMPEEVIRPALVKAAQLSGTRLDQAAHDQIGLDGGQRWLLAILEGHRPGRALADYLRRGESENYDKRHLTKVRNTWFCVETVEPPDLFFAPFARGRHRVIVNDIAAVGSNNLYGIYLKKDCAWTAVGLARWFARDETELVIASASRAYQGTSHKLEPSDLAGLPLPVTAHKHPAKVLAASHQLRLV